MRVNPFLPLNAWSEAKRLRGDRDQREPGLCSPLQRRAEIDRALQVVIFLLTLPGLYLVGDQDPGLRWWGYVLSLAAQPFWLAATWRARQYAMFTIALVFSAMWIRAIAINL